MYKSQLYIFAAGLLFGMTITMLLFPSKAHAGEYLGEWNITRYYVPEKGQKGYANGWKVYDGTCNYKNMYWNGFLNNGRGDYTADVCMNTSGDKYITADGTDVRYTETETIFACPKKYLGEILHVEQIGYGRCADTGGSIKGKRIDLLVGYGQRAFDSFGNTPSGMLEVHLLVK